SQPSWLSVRCHSLRIFSWTAGRIWRSKKFSVLMARSTPSVNTRRGVVVRMRWHPLEIPACSWLKWTAAPESRTVDDETFYRLYYGKTNIPKDIPVRVRKVCVKQLGRRWVRVQPEDWVIEDDEVDFAELLADLGQEFGLSIPDED